MKFILNTAAVATPTKAAFDMQKAEEALNESFTRFLDATVELSSKQQACEELLEIVADSRTAIETFRKYGPKNLETVLAIFNGSNNNLDNALKMETIAAEALTKMDEATRKLKADQYCAALEANVGEAFKAFFEKVKAFLADFIEWLKELFVGNAKLLKMVQEAKFDDLDEDAQFTGITYKDAIGYYNAMLKDGEATLKLYLSENEKLDSNPLIQQYRGAEAPKNESGTVKELGWTKDNAAALAKDFAKIANSQVCKDVTKEVTDDLNKATAEAASGIKEKVEAMSKQFTRSMQAKASVATFNKVVRVIGVTLLRLSKKTKIPAAPGAAEPAKEDFERLSS